MAMKSLSLIASAIAVSAALVAPVAAQPTPATPAAPRVTVTSLLGLGYSLVDTFMTPIGVGLFLQRGSFDGPRPVTLYFCVAEEKPDTTTLETLYCKQIR